MGPREGRPSTAPPHAVFLLPGTGSRGGGGGHARARWTGSVPPVRLARARCSELRGRAVVRHVAGRRACPIPSKRAAGKAGRAAAAVPAAESSRPASRPVPTAAPPTTTEGATTEAVRPPSAADPLPTEVHMTSVGKRHHEETPAVTTSAAGATSPASADWPSPGSECTTGWDVPQSSGTASPTPAPGTAAAPVNGGATPAGAGAEAQSAKRRKPLQVPGEGGQSGPSPEAGVDPCGDRTPSH